MLPDCDPTVLQCPRPRRQGSRVALWSWRECRKIVLSKASSTIAASRPSRQGHVSLQKRRPRIRWCRSCNWSPCRPHRRPFRSGPSGFLVWLNARIASLGNTSGIKSTWKIATREIFGISGPSEISFKSWLQVAPTENTIRFVWTASGVTQPLQPIVTPRSTR